MPRMRFSTIISVALILPPLLAGCGGTEPFVFKKDEFNRSAPDFNVQPTDRDSVTVCYGGWWSTDAEVLAVADAECRRFGKTAFFAERGFGICPLVVPVVAAFRCVPEAESGGADADSLPLPASVPGPTAAR